jgi:hypothetical protein
MHGRGCDGRCHDPYCQDCEKSSQEDNCSTGRCCAQVSIRDKCSNQLEFKLLCPQPRLKPSQRTTADYRRFTVGDGEGDGANMYVVPIPRGATMMSVRLVGAGGSGAGINQVALSVVEENNPPLISGGGGGGSGREYNNTFLLDPRLRQLRLEIGRAPKPTPGDGVDGEPTKLSFIPGNIPGFTETFMAKGGDGGKQQIFEEQGGDGGDGGCGGGGSGNRVVAEVDPEPSGMGGLGVDVDGEDGQTSLTTQASASGGAGGLNPLPRGEGIIGSLQSAGGGGTGGGMCGGAAGIPGSMTVCNKGGNATDITCGGGGSGPYRASQCEIGRIVESLGGRGGDGLAEITFLIQSIPC